MKKSVPCSLPVLDGNQQSVMDWEHYKKTVTPLAEHHTQHVYPAPPSFTAQSRKEPRPSCDLNSSPLFDWDTRPKLPSYDHEQNDRWSRSPAGRIQWRRWLGQKPEQWIDLHGHTVDSAFLAFSNFLREAHENKLRIILCIHGKGLGNPQGVSVLKHSIREWLIYCPYVIAYSSAPYSHGGEGATLIWLRSAKHAAER